MRKNLLLLCVISLLFSSCSILTNSSNSIPYNVATHDQKIFFYNTYFSKTSSTEIPINTSFRVQKTTLKSKSKKKRKVFYNGKYGWVIVLVFKNELEYSVWAEQENKRLSETKIYSKPTNTQTEHIYQTGPRGGQYYINSNGNKTYKKKN